MIPGIPSIGQEGGEPADLPGLVKATPNRDHRLPIQACFLTQGKRSAGEKKISSTNIINQRQPDQSLKF